MNLNSSFSSEQGLPNWATLWLRLTWTCWISQYRHRLYPDPKKKKNQNWIVQICEKSCESALSCCESALITFPIPVPHHRCDQLVYFNYVNHWFWRTSRNIWDSCHEKMKIIIHIWKDGRSSSDGSSIRSSQPIAIAHFIFSKCIFSFCVRIRR